MPTIKSKTWQEETSPEESKVRSTATAKRKSKQASAKPEEPQDIQQRDQPALIINIQSWATPILGLTMLVFGLLVGYYVRPLMPNQTSSQASLNSAPPVVIPTEDNSAAQEKLMVTVLANTRHFKGDPDAPVTIVEFGDFQCPYCGQFSAETEPLVDEQYVQSGKVRFGYYNFAFLGAESNWAAEAAECASDQDKFWEYHDKLYSSQSGENQGAFTKDNLKKFAEELGLDIESFNECLDSGKYTSLIQADTQAASALGVGSTPTFLINGQAVVGAQPFEIFQQTIDALLK